jgi:hypothetical protein
MKYIIPTLAVALFMHDTNAVSVSAKLQKPAKTCAKANMLAQQNSEWSPDYNNFDEARLGTPSERFFLTHEALGGQMEAVIAALGATSGDAAHQEKLQLLRDSLECSESLAKLFPDDIVGNSAEMSKIATAFLNNAFDLMATSGANDPVVMEHLSIINDIVNAAKCPACDSGNYAAATDAASTDAASTDASSTDAGANAAAAGENTEDTTTAQDSETTAADAEVDAAALADAPAKPDAEISDDQGEIPYPPTTDADKRRYHMWEL